MQAGLADAVTDKPPEELAELERKKREASEQVLARYTLLWEEWAEKERPRRQAIDLYGELFALKHQLEAEETANPTELVWGVGLASWQMSWTGMTSGVDFEYPLLTQQMEVGLDEVTMALYLRPRATDTRYEGDAFAGAQVQGAAEVERAVRLQLEQNQEQPVTPFDAGTYPELFTRAIKKGSIKYRKCLY